jgi:hypothetical protein
MTTLWVLLYALSQDGALLVPSVVFEDRLYVTQEACMVEARSMVAFVKSSEPILEQLEFLGADGFVAMCQPWEPTDEDGRKSVTRRM